jgi:signal transduction histidine kinase
VYISNHEIERLSQDIRRIIDGQARDLRNNREGRLSILKNDIHTLAMQLGEQSDALRREKDAMSRALADISHQIKTPLTSAMIMAELLSDAPPEKAHEFAQNIKISLERTQWLVSALLKMAKLEAGTVSFSRAPVGSEELIELALQPLQILLDINEQCVTSSGSASLNCDKRWSAEALTNVIKNASEHSPAGGEISIEAGTNPICDWLSVHDSGSGIAKSELASLFRRFEGSRSEQGYGIGLPLALAIMRAQNGDIEVESFSDGAKFTLKLFK